MIELQAGPNRYTVRRRVELEAKRQVVLAELRRLHEADPGVHNGSAAREVAARIVTRAMERESILGVPNQRLASQAIKSRERLRGAYLARTASAQRVQAMRREARVEMAAAKAKGKKALKRCQDRWKPRFVSEEAKWGRLVERVVRRELVLGRRASRVGCAAYIDSKDLDDALDRAQRGIRRHPAEGWDPATEVFRYFGWKLNDGGIGDEGIVDQCMRLDTRDDAMAFTFYLRAMLSEDPADDLISRALREIEDLGLVVQRAQPSMFSGLSVHELATHLHSPSRRNTERWSGPMSPKEAELAAVRDSYDRLEWFLLAAEQAIEAVTGKSYVAVATKTPATATISAWPSAAPSAEPRQSQPPDDPQLEVLRRRLVERDVKVLLALAKEPTSWLSVQQIAQKTYMSTRTVETAGKTLRELKPTPLIETDRKQGYRLLDRGVDVAGFLERKHP